MEVRVVRSEQDHRAALAEIEALWGAEAGSPESDRLEALVALVEQYESRRWPDDAHSFDPIDALNFAIEELGHDRAELGRLLGSRSRASEILARKRALTVPMIYAINRAWGVPAELLVRPYALIKAA